MLFTIVSSMSIGEQLKAANCKPVHLYLYPAVRCPTVKPLDYSADDDGQPVLVKRLPSLTDGELSYFNFIEPFITPITDLFN